MRIPPDLRAAWDSLAEAESDVPGHDYDRGYLTGWYDVRHGHRKRVGPRGLYRDSERVAEFRLGYLQGREDGQGRPADWWPEHARGRLRDGLPIAPSGLGERPFSSQPAAEALAAVSVVTSPSQTAPGP